MVVATRSTILFALLILAGCSMSARECALLSDEQLQRINLNTGDCHDEQMRRIQVQIREAHRQNTALAVKARFRLGIGNRLSERQCERLTGEELKAVSVEPFGINCIGVSARPQERVEP